MIKLIKRLELIKTAISLEDEEIIELQIIKLANIENDEDIQQIIDLISKTRYEQVINLIDIYLEKYKGVILYEDPEVQGLRVELKILEKDLQNLSEEKIEYTHLINEFNAQSNLRLGDLIQEILRLRKELSFEEMKNKSDDNDEFEEAAKQYKQTKQDYEEFSEDYSEQLKEMPLELTEDEAKELKQAYRKAGKLCHPDVVVDDVKEEAEEVFKTLNEAYAKNDLEAVKKILNDLESGYVFAKSSDVITDKDILRMKIEDIRVKIDSMSYEINEIKKEETFQTIVEVDDWDDYFNDLKKQLEEELEELNLAFGNKKEFIKDVESSFVFANIALGVSEKEDNYFDDTQSTELDWIQKIWDWGDEYNIPDLVYLIEYDYSDEEGVEEWEKWEGLSRNKEKLLAQTELNLRGMNLPHIPKELGNLTNLKIIALSNNKLSNIPKEFYNLLNLTELYISSNELEYFSKDIGKLSNLEIIYAGRNQLTKFPYELVNLKKLINLNLDENNIHILPDCISNLHSLKYLALSFNQLTKVSPNIGKLQCIQMIDLGYNQLNTLPDEIFSLKELFRLDLGHNPLFLTEKQKELLTKLEKYFYCEIVLDEGILHKERANIVSNQYDKNGDDSWIQNIWDWADENYIEDYTWMENVDNPEFSYWIGLPRNKEDLLWLKELHFQEKYFEKIPKEIGNLTSLEKLDIYANLTELPKEIGNLINLKIMNIPYNKLTNFPDEMRNLQNLQQLNIYDNNFIELPKVVGSLINLRELYYSVDIGKLPKEISNLHKLTNLWISDNQLTMMPKELGSLTNLTSLRIYSKNEKQLLRFPDEIINLKKLKKIELNYHINLELTEKQKLWLEDLKRDNDLSISPDIWEEVQEIPF